MGGRRCGLMKRPPVRSDLQEMSGYHSPQVDVEVRLNTNEAPFPPPEEFQSAFVAELKEVEWNRYPDRAAQLLREDLAALHDVEPAQIFVANGSNEVLQTLCLTFGGYGRTALSFTPTYAMYAQIARTTQCRVVEVPRDENFLITSSILDNAIENEAPELLFLCSPNNPTGTPESIELVRAAISRAPGLVVVDEAYGQFADFTAIDLFSEDPPPESLVVTRTFSKTWSMAGVRLGYCVMPSWMLNEFEKVVLPYHLDSVKQVAGRVALRFYEEMEERVSQIAFERSRIEAQVANLGLTVWRSQANFVMLRTTPSGRSGDEVWERLLRRSVLVRNCSSWPGLLDCLRVTVGTPSENTTFLAALEEALQ